MTIKLGSAARSVPWLITAGALFLTLRALLGQVALQSELVVAMHGVRTNVHEAVGLTRGTAVALQPLAATTVTLERINGRLQKATQDLVDVNRILDRMVSQQRSMRDTLISINGQSRTVVTTLDEIDRSNRDLLITTEGVAHQTEIQASVLERLRSLTAESIGQLRRLNQKLSFLAP